MSLPEFKLQSYARMRLLLSLHAERPAAAVKYGISVTFPHQDDRGGGGGGLQADGLYRKNRIYCLTNAPAHQSTLMSFLISSGSVLVALSGAFRTDARLLNKKARRQHPRPPHIPSERELHLKPEQLCLCSLSIAPVPSTKPLIAAGL